MTPCDYRGDTMYVHQLTGSVLRGAGLTVEVTTEYPWNGRVQLRVTEAPTAERGLAVRVPGWAETAAYRLNHDPERSLPPGYLHLHRVWTPGDVITLGLALTPRGSVAD
jgi:hypothetical protein